MARVWLGVAIGGLGVGVLLAMTNCAEPTQIVVDVFTDACPGPNKKQSLNSTGIAVGTADNIESRRPSSTTVGCAPGSGSIVGNLTIYPSGNKDDEVAIKVLGGIESTPDRCEPPFYAGCIVHRRQMRFIPNTTQHVTVRLLLACLNRQCPPGFTCDNGACVAPSALLDDGGTIPDADRIESSVVPDAADPCAGCKGDCVAAGATKKCVVDCSKVDCAGEQCAKALDCEIRCSKTDKCADVKCTTDKKCTVTCGPEKNSCAKVTCAADECDVHCGLPGGADEVCNANGNIILVAVTRASLDCEGKRACKTASCNSGTCTLKCNPAQPKAPQDTACPISSPACIGGCKDWNTPNP